ncbi:MAG: hypothetical protein COV74_02445 [Candidatus Omnitrophica bacterium CG11_big_fil_rev_8_21_14_0_20_45_26]|uniref:histidine kinase n=1 Tax=Candidatus Abzuiibacterium crystallinum TaxID=1974748 RepID=A0A2H0LTM4_9BACT|nr:MAG: hypothetical protein COV74_02445 [Candidatus Omnitrophica bacterium CG11_big_fil_rev_8_21_14_0_20_45_26]PIW65697.1 MAG: hypothetical protein COW12_00290 [Candidatus Omnitrophica bacterium CG12_big_fil_rev_8_21_14_0_65_45_16]
MAMLKKKFFLFFKTRRQLKLWKWFSQQSLTVKLVGAVSIIVCLTVGFGTFLLMNISQQRIAETSITTALYHAQLIKSKLIEILLDETAQPEDIDRFLKTGYDKQNFDVQEINAFNEDGLITFSSSPEQLGRQATVLSGQTNRVTQDNAFTEFVGQGIKERLHIIQPIKINATCPWCRDETGNRINGIELFIPLSSIYQRFVSNNILFICLGVILIFFIALLIQWLVHRIVKRPLNKLMQVMERAEQGELDVRTSIREDPQLRRLAKSFNTMIHGIQMAQNRISRQHRHELAQSNRLASIGQFVSNISHEIKNPLAAISSAFHALRNELKSTGNEAVYEEVKTQIEKIERTVNNLLRYARQSPPHWESCRLLEVIHSALHLAGHRLKRQGIRVQVMSSASVPIVEADQGMLEQVFLNLFLNSADAMLHGGLLTISIDQREYFDQPNRAKQIVRVEVEDTGEGIREDDLAKIFEAFYSTKRKGTGLGLSVVKGIIEAHHGTIEVKSLPDKGTKIILSFQKFMKAENLVTV